MDPYLIVITINASCDRAKMGHTYGFFFCDERSSVVQPFTRIPGVCVTKVMVTACVTVTCKIFRQRVGVCILDVFN